MEEILKEKTITYPFKLLILSILIEPDFLKKIIRIASPIAASAAATKRIKSEKIWPERSSSVNENPTKLMFADNNINSIDIKIVIMFFLFIKIPKKPIEKTVEDKTR
tara:strand:+ start:1012 stop:1332 length:321 start_codon:yes stop_codon:yes gene_type:complete